MFRLATQQNTSGAQQQLGNITPVAIPAKGLNARDAFALMGSEYAISLVNAVCDPYGLRTRKGYTEWARNIAITPSPVGTVMAYYPATAAPTALRKKIASRSTIHRMLVEPRSPSTPPNATLFAAAAGTIHNVTAGGLGPFPAMAGVAAPAGGGDFWTWINFQNIAGAFLIACNNDGGYAYYDGAAWHTPVAGAGVGQINGCDPAKFCYVVEWKKRLWFIEKQSTRAWYLPVSQITGNVTQFNFGEQFRHGGELTAVMNWTIDGGIGIDDYLIAISSQGDIAVYKGTDPDDPTAFEMQGVYHLGPLPVGRRCVLNTGADIHILSQLGVTALSHLLNTSELGEAETKRLSYMISPLIGRLMRESASLEGWQIVATPKEELFLIGMPPDSSEFGGGQFFGLKLATGGWSVLSDLPYSCFVSIDSDIFAGTYDNRVVRAFDGPLDNVLIGATTGLPIKCQVTPAYNSMEQGFGTGARQKVFKLFRPTFITTVTPTVSLQVMTDYGAPKAAIIPTLPSIVESLWDVDLWDVAKWTGLQDAIKKWLGIAGVGFVGTVQMDYICGGDTLLASMDFWTEQGGVL